VYSDFDFIVFSFNFSSVVVCIFHFYCSVFLVFVLPSGVIKNDRPRLCTASCGKNQNVLPRQSLYRSVIFWSKIKVKNAIMPKSVFGGNSSYSPIYFSTPKLLFCKVRVTDVVRCPCSDFCCRIMAPYKLYY